jgi:hypothetical protein
MPLPSLYARWAEELLAHPVPEETAATCDDCAMCLGEDLFDPRIKCCTYLPDLPNFLVGGAIREGRETVERRLREREGLSPLGLGRSSEEERIWRGVGQSFGLTPEVRCPYYEPGGGLCGIWPHRNAACATYFCRYARGPAWRGFWWILNRLLAEVERDLAAWCRMDLGAPDGWGPWDGREGEFFVECAGRVRDLSWAEVSRICGPGVEIFAGQARKAQEGLLSQAIPDFLQPGVYRVVETGTVRRWITTDERFGPIRVSQDVLDLLPRFDGRSTRDVILSITRDQCREMDETLIHHLLGYGLLVPRSV